MGKRETLLWADLLKILAIFAVVLIHAAAPALLGYRGQGAGVWWAGNLYDSLARWCIPVFFMLSGAFLIPEAGEISLQRFFLRRFQRVFIPFLLWSAIYFLWRIHLNGESLAWHSFVPLFLKEPVYYHLWFFYVLVELYLLAPIVAVFAKHAGPTVLWYFFSLWFVFGSLVPQLQGYFRIETYFTLGEAPTVFTYLGYFVLGHALREFAPARTGRVLLTLLFILAFGITAYGTYHVTVQRNAGVLSELFYHYHSVNVAVMAVAAYLIAKSSPALMRQGAGSGKHSGLKLIASCVPGIYLVHPMVMTLYSRGALGFTLSAESLPPIFGIPLFALAVFTGSLVAVMLTKLIPGVKYVVP